MDRLIYTALSGMNASMVQQRMLAHNMANASTTGFRAEIMASSPATLTSSGVEARAHGNGVVRGARMDAGPVETTGRMLDVALNSTALLAVQAADGQEAYTRRGDLSVSANGLLVNGEGYPVMGTAGPIALAPDAQITLTPDGRILAADRGAPDTPPQEIDRLKLASPEGSRIWKGLDGLFRVQDDGILPDDEDATLISGALEQSNVKPADVLVQMVEAQRLFEMRTKMLSTAREVDEGGASLMRLG